MNMNHFHLYSNIRCNKLERKQTILNMLFKVQIDREANRSISYQPK